MDVSKFINQLDKKIKIIALSGSVLIIYGLFAKSIPINFFWESTDLGIILIAGSIGVILIVEFLIKIKILSSYYRSGWRTFFHIIFIILVIGIESLFYLSNSLEAAKNEIKVNSEIKEEVGDILGFGWITAGSNSTGTNSEGKYVFATYEILVKGTKAYKYVTVDVGRINNEPWEIEITSR